jgi:hypothetical protein
MGVKKICPPDAGKLLICEKMHSPDGGFPPAICHVARRPARRGSNSTGLLG